MEKYDVVVVGGGPAGAAVARDIASAGFTVAILERDSVIGRPVQCSGLVTERTLTAAGISPDIAHNALRGATIHAPSGARYEIGGDRIHAYVLDRSQFDLDMMVQALEYGVQLHAGTRVIGIGRESNEIQVLAEYSGQTKKFAARLIIGADGPRSIVADFLDLPPPAEVLRARGADVRLPNRPKSDRVLIFTGLRYAPGFFAWAIPLGDDRFRVGWGTSRPGPANGLNHLVNDYPEIFDGIEIYSQTGGLIPLGPRPVTSGAGGMVVGDAAGQAKATSGGGLFTALVCARYCARTAIEALMHDDTSAPRLAHYDRAWRSDIGKELEHATTLRSAYRELSDSELEWGLRLLRFRGIRHLVDRHGDIDYPSHLAAVALRAAPSLLRLAHGHSELLAPVEDECQPAVQITGS